jgi:hypothetical protein
MQPLDTYDLVTNIFVVVMMPLIILANLRLGAAQSPIQMYFWREHPNFVRASFVMLILLTIYSAIELMGHFGVIAPDKVDAASTGLGIAFLFVSVAVIVLAVRAGLKAWRSWKPNKA